MAKSAKKKRSKNPNLNLQQEAKAIQSKTEVHTLTLAKNFYKGELQKDPRALNDVKELMERLSTATPSPSGPLDKNGNVIGMTRYLNAGGCRKYKVRELKIDHGNKPLRLFTVYENNKFLIAHAIFKKSDGTDYIRECDKAAKKVAQYQRDGEHFSLDEIMPLLGDKPNSIDNKHQNKKKMKAGY